MALISGPPKPPVPGGNEWARASTALGRVLATARKQGKYDQVIDAVWESIRTPEKPRNVASIMKWIGRNRGALVIVAIAAGAVLGKETVERLFNEQDVHLPEVNPLGGTPPRSEDDLLSSLDQIPGGMGPTNRLGGALASPVGLSGTALSMARVKRLRAQYGSAAEAVVEAMRSVSAADFVIYDTLQPY